MNEIMMYTGTILGVLFLLLSVYLFFKGHVIEVIKYLLHKNDKKSVYKRREMAKTMKPITSKALASNRITRPSVTKVVSEDKTEVLPMEDTEILEIAQNYATAMLDAQETELLPELNK